jgi:DNA-binding MarR family transcriptional regulator
LFFQEPFPSCESIAEKAHCDRATVSKAIKALEDSGVLTWVNRIARVREWGRWSCVEPLVRHQDEQRLHVPRSATGRQTARFF